MRRSLFSASIVVAGVVWGGQVSAASVVIPRFSSTLEAVPVEEVGYWRRQYRRHGYPVPYVYPPFAHYPPPPAYVYPHAYGYYEPLPAEGGYPAEEGDYSAYPPANEDTGDYPPENGY
jgi:hypothetical protein